MAVNVGQRHVPDTPSTARCYAVDAAMELAEHTLKNCKNEKHFSPEYKDFITRPLVTAARNTFVKSYTANKIRVADKETWEERKDLQLEAIRSVTMMPALITLARKLNHLRKNKCEYWIKLSITARDLLKKWHAADKRRYKDLM